MAIVEAPGEPDAGNAATLTDLVTDLIEAQQSIEAIPEAQAFVVEE